MISLKTSVLSADSSCRDSSNSAERQADRMEPRFVDAVLRPVSVPNVLARYALKSRSTNLS